MSRVHRRPKGRIVPDSDGPDATRGDGVKRPCALLIFDRKLSRDGPIVFRACGFLTWGVVSVHGDMLFAACGRHRGRLSKLGVKVQP